MINAVPQRRAQGKTAQATTIPPPTMGIDTTKAAGQLPPENCYYTFNMMPAERGMLLRKGYREHAIITEANPASDDGTRTIFGYQAAGVGSVGKKLFATTAEGIWDVTAYDTLPTQEVVFTDTTSEAGYGIVMHYIDQAGADYLWYSDSKNGLWEYTGASGTWARPTGITGTIDITKVCFVVNHKQRIWLIEEDSAQAWYLPVAAKAGAATAFYFGSKFPHGGILKGLYNWTIDGGDGVDDFLVAISSTGDVIPYKGTDPSTADTWGVVGSYYIGQTPEGRKIATEHSGELYMLSEYGLTSMSMLLQGVNTIDALSGVAAKIAQPLRAKMVSLRDEKGWDIRFCPSIGSIVITIPKEESQLNLAFVLNMTVNAWGYWRGVPLTCFVDHNNYIHFGDSANVVHIMDTTKDGVTIAGDTGEPVKFSMLTSYQNYSQPAILKQVQYIRPDFFSSQLPSYDSRALYDYDLSELNTLIASSSPSGSVWDVGLWDSAIWGSSQGTGQFEIRGSGGLGRSIAIALKGSAIEETRLTSFDVIWTSGGPT